MRNDQIFVLLLVVLLPMSGCFDGGTAGVGEAEGAQDSGEVSETTVVNNYYNNTTSISNAQERVWYSTGDVVNKYWNDGQDFASAAQRCLEFGPSYDSDTGEYLGEECKEMGYPSSLSDWNGSDCDGVLSESGTNPRYAPTCTIVAQTITTSSGEALILYEMQSIVITTTCDGILSYTTSSVNSVSHYGSGGEGHRIVTGSAMNCSHEIAYTQTYVQSSSSALNDMKILSLVYAIQDTVVV